MFRTILFDIVSRHRFNKLINTHQRIISKKLNSLNSKIRKESDEYLQSSIGKYGFQDRTSSKYFDFYYSISGIDSPDYIPVPVYLKCIEPILNQNEYAVTLSDKNSYQKIFKDFIYFPETLLRKINNHFYDKDYNYFDLDSNSLKVVLGNKNKIILKASLNSGSGKNIEVYERQGEDFFNVSTTEKLEIDYLKNFSDFIIQDFIEQHIFFKKFNPESNNTIRILTYRSVVSDNIFILHRLFRIGAKGSFLDHDNKGGLVVGISDGKLNNVGRDKSGREYISYNGINLIDETDIPYLNKIEEISIKMANQFYYTRLLAMDFSVNTSGEPLLIEINTQGNGTGQYQMNNGPLFGNFTNEILDYCYKNKYSKGI